MKDNNNIKLSWGQYWSFTEEEIMKATENVITIKSKILQLHDKLKKVVPLDEEIKIKINNQIDRLQMSKECIKYYYKLETLL